VGYRLLVDEDVHAATAAVLRDRGHDAVSVRAALDSGASDAEVVAHALGTDRLVVTHDADYLRPSIPDDLRVCYVPRDTMGPGGLRIGSITCPTTLRANPTFPG
jgi:hypothetical protein